MASFRNLLGLPVKLWDNRAAGQVLQLSSDKEHWEFGVAALPQGVPYLVADGQTFRVAAGMQALWSIPIDLEGDAYLDIEGALVEVA